MSARLLTDYLLKSYGIGKSLSWAIAGRSESKLNTLKSGLGKDGAQLPVIVADAADEDALKAMCDQTRVVISTVGPLRPVRRAACQNVRRDRTGTDYCDLTR